MTTFDDHGRPEPPLAAGEAETLLGFLDYQRATLGWKTEGLDGTGLRATVGPSSMTLGGLLKHMALVEDHWFTARLRGRARPTHWDGVDWNADPDWEWHSAADDTPEQLRALWAESVAQARSAVEEAMAEGGLDQMAKAGSPSGETASFRWIVVHMIEEYARHNGHADLIRESIDGSTGE